MNSPLPRSPLCVRSGDDLVIGDGGAFDGAADQTGRKAVGQVAAIEAIGPFPKVARQVLGANAVVSTDQPRLDIAEDGMDDREELGSVGAGILDHRCVLEMVAKCRLATLVALETVGQQVRFGGDVGFDEAAEFVCGGGGQHGDPDASSVKPMLALHRMSVFFALLLRCRNLLDDRHDQAPGRR